MATPLKVLTALSASYGAAVSGSSGLIVNQGGVTINNNGGLTVNSNGITVTSGGANITGQLTANTGLVVSDGALQVSNGGISGSSTLQVGGAATFANNVTVAGNLTVNGTTTTVNTTELLIKDDKIIIASGSANAFDANGAGIFLGNESPGVASIQYVSSAMGDYDHRWKSSENIDLAQFKSYLLDGVMALNRNTTDTTAVNVLSNGGPSSQGKVVVGAVDSSGASQLGLIAGSGSFVSGSNVVLLKAPSLILSGTTLTKVSNDLDVLGTISVVGTSYFSNAQAQQITASTGVSASVFVLADGTQLTSSTQLGGGGGGSGDATKSGINSEYNSLRLVLSGSLDANGHRDVDLTALNATNFGVASLHSCSVDVMTDADGTGWTNDLVSVRLEVSASALYVKIDAPAAPNAGYRLIAVNEKDFNLT